jgi:TRAP-type C4-dicarboxylate transport system substrate-binding protein
MRPTTILAAPTAAIFAVSATNAKEFRSSDVHPMNCPAVQAVAYIGKIIGEKTGAPGMVCVNVAPFNNIVPATIVRWARR